MADLSLSWCLVALVAWVGCSPEESAPGPGAGADADAGDGEGEAELDCMGASESFSSTATALAAERAACRVDEDCALVDASLSCDGFDISLGECPLALSAAEAADFEATLPEETRNLCVVSLDGCRAGPSCPALEAVCEAGLCEERVLPP